MSKEEIQSSRQLTSSDEGKIALQNLSPPVSCSVIPPVLGNSHEAIPDYIIYLLRNLRSPDPETLKDRENRANLEKGPMNLTLDEVSMRIYASDKYVSGLQSAILIYWIKTNHYVLSHSTTIDNMGHQKLTFEALVSWIRGFSKRRYIVSVDLPHDKKLSEYNESRNRVCGKFERTGSIQFCDPAKTYELRKPKLHLTRDEKRPMSPLQQVSDDYLLALLSARLKTKP